MTEKVIFSPIGYIHSPYKEPNARDFEDMVARIEINEDFKEGLEGLDGFSHINVIFYMHRGAGKIGEDRTPLKVRPMGFVDLPLVGVFATRSPHRPNRLGITLCELISVVGNVIEVKGLDALDGSPVIDIKSPLKVHAETYGIMRFPEWTSILRRRIGKE